MYIVHPTKYNLSLFAIYCYTFVTTFQHHNNSRHDKDLLWYFLSTEKKLCLSGSLREEILWLTWNWFQIDFKYIFWIGPYKFTIHCHFHWMKSHGHLLDFYLFYCPFVLREAVSLIQSLPSQGRPCFHSTRLTLSYNVLFLQQLVFHRAKKEQLPNNY